MHGSQAEPPLKGITLLEHRLSDPTVTVGVLFRSVSIEPSTRANANFAAKVWFAVSLDGVGNYPGHAVFLHADPFFDEDHDSYVSTSTLPVVNPEDVSHLKSDCPAVLAPLLLELARKFLREFVDAKSSGNRGPMVRWASLTRTESGFVLDRWEDLP